MVYNGYKMFFSYVFSIVTELQNSFHFGAFERKIFAQGFGRFLSFFCSICFRMIVLSFDGRIMLEQLPEWLIFQISRKNKSQKFSSRDRAYHVLHLSRTAHLFNYFRLKIRFNWQNVGRKSSILLEISSTRYLAVFGSRLYRNIHLYLTAGTVLSLTASGSITSFSEIVHQAINVGEFWKDWKPVSERSRPYCIKFWSLPPLLMQQCSHWRKQFISNGFDALVPFPYMIAQTKYSFIHHFPTFFVQLTSMGQHLYLVACECKTPDSCIMRIRSD